MKFNFLYAKEFLLYLLVGAISTMIEWIFLIFKSKNLYLLKEILKIYFVSLIGLCLNLIIMFFAIEKFNVKNIFAKILATGIVFAWNFLIRKYVVYKI